MNSKLGFFVVGSMMALLLGACYHYAPAIVAEQRISATEPTKPQPQILVLSPATKDERTGTFFAAFCNWVSTTREATELYPVVILLSPQGDPISTALTELDEALDSLPRNADKSQHLGSISARDAVDKIKEKLSQARQHAYSCATNPVPDNVSVTLVTASYVNVAPYGPGMEYQVLSPDHEQRRGFFRLGDPMSRGDSRLFALRVLPDPAQQLVVQQTAAVPDHDECSSSAPALACVYQDAKAKIELTAVDSLLLRGHEINLQPWDRWGITRDDMPAEQDVSIETPQNQPGHLLGTVHFKQPGRFVFHGTASPADAFDVAKVISFAVDVKLRAVVLHGTSYRNDSQTVRQASVMQLLLRLRQDIRYNCFSYLLIYCARNGKSLKETIVDRAANARALSSDDVMRLLALLQQDLTKLPPPYSRPDLIDSWQKLLQRTVNIDAFRVLLEMPQLRVVLRSSPETGNEFNWCSGVASAIVRNMQIPYPNGYNPTKGAQWLAGCIEMARISQSNAEGRAGPIVVSAIEPVSGDDVLAIVSKQYALELNERGYLYYQGEYPEGTGGVAIQSRLPNDEPVEPIVVTTHVQGVRPPLGIGVVGSYLDDVRRPAIGLQAEIWPLEVLGLSGDITWTSGLMRERLRASLSFLCFAPGLYEACRELPMAIDGSGVWSDRSGMMYQWGFWFGFGRTYHIRLGIDVHGRDGDAWIYVARQFSP